MPNFLELREGEVRRMILPRTRVNRRSKLLLQVLLALTACLSATIRGTTRWGRIPVPYYTKGSDG
jgi:hypothetical protein